jgi:hypothetical protein
VRSSRGLTARAVALLTTLIFGVPLSSQVHDRTQLRVSLDRKLGTERVSGRLIMLMTSDTKPMEVIEPGFLETIDRTWVASKEVKGLAPGEFIDLEPGDSVFPRALAQLPVGDYQVMALLDRDHNAAYNTLTPGDLRTSVMPLKQFNPTAGPHLDLTLTTRVPELRLDLPSQAELVTIRSPSLSSFWGRPIDMRAVVVVPADYASSNVRYPTSYGIHGFTDNLEWLAGTARLLQKEMADGNLPPMIWVLPEQWCPGGTHEFVDSVNNGPWGRAFTSEFIPQLERRYRMDATPRGRFLNGHSSGGWASLWLQVAYPNVFGGTWSTAPDPVAFREFLNVDLETATNLYHLPDGTPTPMARVADRTVETLEQFSRQERVLGEFGGQMASFEWVFSPRGIDGRPKPMFDRATGSVDRDVANYWLARYDISRVLVSGAPRLARELRGKIHVIVGADDTFYLDRPVRLLQRRFESLGYDARFTYIPHRGHFDLYDGHLLSRIAEQMYRVARRDARWTPREPPDRSTKLAN